MTVAREGRRWEELAQQDPLWAILSYPDGKYGGWDEEEFLPVLLYLIDRFGENWELVDRLRTQSDGDEFGFLLRRMQRQADGQTVAQRFVSAWRSLGDQATSDLATSTADADVHPRPTRTVDSSYHSHETK